MKRLFMINTDSDCYRKMRRAPQASPFNDHWLRLGFAFMTPPKKDPNFYDSALAELRTGDFLFAYESEVGIVALGTVSAQPSLDPIAGGTALYPDPDEIVLQFPVAWDPTVELPVQEITAAGTTPRGGPIPLWRVGSPKMLALLTDLLAESEVHKRDEQELAALARIQADATLTLKEREAIGKARIGHGVFRSRLLGIEKGCRITGISDPAHLRASHIKPWVECAGQEHLDGNNGLLLSPHVDHLFDQGFISFEDDGRMLLSSRLAPALLHAWSIPIDSRVGPFNAEQARYMAYHRTHRFKREDE